MSILSILMKSDPNEPSSEARDDCPLCTGDGARLIWRGAFWRAVAVDDPGYPGYVRLILNRHCTELTAISSIEQEQLFKLLIAMEKLMREILAPDKVNIASLGNQVPHLHWHIIPRWKDDPCFPDSIWSTPRREAMQAANPARLAAAKDFLSRLPTLCPKTIY